MFPALRLWAAGLALIACACQEQDGAAAPPAAADPAEEAVDPGTDVPATVPPEYDTPLALAGDAHQCAKVGDHPAALDLYRSAFAALPAQAEADQPEFVARLHDGLGRALQNAGQLDQAEHHLATGLEIRSRLPGLSGVTERGISEGHLGLLYLVLGRYADAEQLFHAALRHTPEQETGLLILRHDCFGRYYLSLRAHDLAAGHFEQALRLATVNSAADDPLVLDLRHSLALCRFRAGEHAEALREVEDILTDLPEGPDAQLRRAGLLNLAGTIRAADGDVESAGARIAEALDIVRTIKGNEHPALAPLHANLGAVRLQAGRPQEALASLQQAERLFRANVGAHHQSLVEVLYQIAAAHLETSPPAKARQAAVVARRTAGELLSALLVNGSERELLTFRSQVDLHSILCRLGDAELIANSVLDAKGRIMEAVLQRRTGSRQATQRIGRLRAELDQLLLDHSTDASDRIAQLRTQIEAISGEEAAAAPAPPSLRWPDVRGALPPGAAFLDYVRFRPAGTAEEEARFGAILILPDRPPQWIPLADESRLNRLDLLHRSLSLRADILRHAEGRAGVPMAPLLADLYRAFWMPIAENLPDQTREIIVCPEGTTHLLPFAVLRNPDGRFLCEAIPVVRIVDSSRSLVRAPQAIVGIDTPWMILGVSDFAPHRKRLRQNKDHWSPAWTAALTNIEDLPTVRDELDSLRTIAPKGSTILLDRKAKATPLHALDEPPAILHLATHGFHVPLGGGRDLAADPSALYENGILLEPDNNPHDGGILFPEEIATLDLRGTRLVTLSTCRSALGRPVSGEGVLGLSRGFAKAGARSILASLWEIPDQSTAAFMREFYRSLASGNDPASHLWSIQAARFTQLRDEDPTGDKVETAILSIGGFRITSP